VGCAGPDGVPLPQNFCPISRIEIQRSFSLIKSKGAELGSDAP